MTDFENRLLNNFCCPKCRGKSAATKTVPLSRGLGDLLGLSANRYVLLTCALCGYTEIYDSAAVVLGAEPASAAPPLADKAP